MRPSNLEELGLTFKTHAIAATALLFFAGASQAAAEDRDSDAIKLTRPHHHRAATTQAKTDASVHAFDRHAAPDVTAHDPDPHHHSNTMGKEANEFATTKPFAFHAADSGHVNADPSSDAIIPPPGKSIFFRSSSIDKKMMGAIGLLRPQKPKSFTASLIKKPSPQQTLSSNALNGVGNHGKETMGTLKTAAFAGVGRPVGAHNFAWAPTGAVATFAVRPPNPAAVHDAMINGTGLRRPVSVIASIGGAPIRKPTFALSGSDVHLKMR